MNQLPKLFLGTARHLNYRRTFIARDCVRVDIPGLPFTSFDNTGKKVYPWGILNLIESVRFFTLADHAWTGAPGQSLLDFHEIFKSHLIFIVGTNIKVEPKFYKHETPKHPLYVIEKLKHMGKSSKTLSYDLYHADTDTPYFTCDVTDVLVSPESRRPVSYPDWWMEKYGDLITPERARFIPEVVPESLPCVSEYKVRVSDLDSYQHTNWTAYLKLCYESLYEHVDSDLDLYGTFNSRILHSGAKTVNISYKDESKLGDTLTIKSWISNTQKNRVVFCVFNGDVLCVHSYIDF